MGREITSATSGSSNDQPGGSHQPLLSAAETAPAAVVTGELLPAAPPPALGFYELSYSYTRLSAVAGQTQLYAKRQRLRDGVIETEEWQGMTHLGLYQAAMGQMQQLMEAQVTAMAQLMQWQMSQLSTSPLTMAPWLLPFIRR